MFEVAVVAALPREIGPLVKGWRRVEREFGMIAYEFFESDSIVLVCGGIGADAARRATEAIVGLYQPTELISVGFAGALEGKLRVGDVFEPELVVDARDGSRWPAEGGSGVVVSFASVADQGQKAKLGRAYSAQAVDMEAASVAKGAEAHKLRFRAVKAISDEVGFSMPAMERFVTQEGRFRTSAFAISTVLRPWTWGSVFQLARNSAKASRNLCARLSGLLGIQQNRGGAALGVQNRS